MKKFNFKALAQTRGTRLLSLTALAALVFALPASADGLGDGFGQAAQNLKDYIPMVQKIIYAFAGLVFLVGAGSIYVKMANGDQDVKSSIMMYVGGVLFLLIAANLAPSIFVRSEERRVGKECRDRGAAER